MKILLGISLILNVVLGILYFQKQNEPPLERFIMEHSNESVTEDKPREKKKTHPKSAMMVNTMEAAHLPPVTEQDEAVIDPPTHVDGRDYEELADHIQTAKKEYLLNQLNLEESVFKKGEKLRKEYIKEINRIYNNKNANPEMSINDRRQLLALEEAYQNKLKQAYGEKNWEKFEHYRNKYNESVWKKVREDGAPAIFMGP